MDDFSDSGVRDKLVSLERDFFASLAEGSQPLQSFLNSWDGFKESLASVELSSHTWGLVYSLATTVCDVSTGMVELHEFATDITETLKENMIQPSTGSEISTPASYPAYIEPSCKWLLENLHNPYPSKETRIAISIQARCPRRYVDNWFIDARKRIGWNTLRKTHFSNKRIEVIDAATRFFVKDDPDRPLAIAIEMEFATMQARAQLLHTGFKGSPLANELCNVTKYTNEQEQGITSYPSPEPSPGPSLRTSLLPATVEVSIRHDCKRRNSVTSLDLDPVGLPNKRPRLDVDYHLPSPSPSVDAQNKEDSVVVPIKPLSVNKRKRRLSDGGCYGYPKRVCDNISMGPRLHTASDPTCSTSVSHGSSPLDGWFHDFLESVSVEAPDSSDPLDVNVYDCTRFDLQNQTSDIADLDSPSPFHIFSADTQNNLANSDLFSLGKDFSVILPGSVINSISFSPTLSYQLGAELAILPPSPDIIS